jgi:predicted secreted hydrolase
LSAGKGPIPQGDDGLSRKSAEPGNASYYYSYPRLPAAGEIRIGRERVAVAGTAWMDREWSTSALADDQVGWDWFSIQLTDGRELMFYRLRRRDGSVDPMSAGSLVAASGEVVRLSSEDVELEPEDYWESPQAARYPVRWRMRLPKERLDLEVAAYVLDQEHRHSFRYWEGAVSVRGIEGEEPISGDGYLEMTGYGSEGASSIAR